MDLRSRLADRGFLLFSVFYLIAGIWNFIILGINGFNPPHIALVAFLSLISAIGMFRLARWLLWLVIGLFFIVTTYAAFMLNYTIGVQAGNWISIVMWSIYLLFTWAATLFVIVKRDQLT
jgi:hypothetical protein